MGRQPKHRTEPGVIFIRLPADEYNAAVDEIILKRRSTFQDHVRNCLLAPTTSKKTIILLETIIREAELKEGLLNKVISLLKDLKGIR